MQPIEEDIGQQEYEKWIKLTEKVSTKTTISCNVKL